MTAVVDTAVTGGVRDIRTNLFLAATLFAGETGAVPVKVRNLSPGGALIEAATLPSSGSAIRLARGALGVTGAVAWAAGNRCGLSFDGAISVKDWMSPPVNGAQQRIDRAVSQLRSSGTTQLVSRRAGGCVTVTDEFQIMAQLMEQLGEALSADGELLVLHHVQLQKIDIVTQMLEATGGALAERPGSARRLADLRASAEQALRSGTA